MNRIHEYLLDFFMALFALSTLALWGVTLSGGSFRTYAVIMLAVPLVAAYLVMLNSRGLIPPAPVETSAESYKNRFRIEYIVIAALLLGIFFSESSVIMVALLLVIVFLLLRKTVTPPQPFTSFSALEKSPFIPGAALVIAVTYTLVSHRPTQDDALYLFFGLLPLNQPMQAINLLPIYDTGRMLVSYPSIEAVVSYWTGISYLQVYYLVVPALAAMLSVFAYYGLFQRSGSGYAGVLTFMTIIILILWGDETRSPGNFSFATLGIGKAMFYTAVCPYLVSSALGVLTRHPGSNLRLAAASISGIGLTQSAIVLVPLFFTGLILAAWLVYREPSQRARYLPFLTGLVVFTVLAAGIVTYLGKIPATKPHDSGLREALDVVFGDGLRGPLSIACVGLLPLLAQDNARHKALIALCVALLLVALNPVVVYLAGQAVWSLTWRLQWLLLLAAMTATGIFLAADFIARGKPSLRLLLCALGLAGFAMLGQTTFSESNRNRIGFPQIKPPPTINGIFKRHHTGRYKLHVDYRLENGRICMANGCY